LNPRLRGTPPWNAEEDAADEASHEGSYCWVASNNWVDAQQMAEDAALRKSGPFSIRSSEPTTPTGSDAASSIRVPSKSSRRGHRWTKESDNTSYSGYGPGIEKVDEWPMREESRVRNIPSPLIIKDFDHDDDYHF